MMLTALANFLLTTTLLQMIPIDALDFERRALSTEEIVPISVHSAFSFSNAHLPMAKNINHAPTKRKVNSIGVVTSARSAIVLDRTTGKILFQKNIDEPRSIGSITKLMTAHVFLQSGADLDEEVSLFADDVRFGGVQHLSLGDTYSIRELLYASLVGSDNTATAALARLSHLSLGDFIARMNEEAALIGMEHTRFVDPTGLSSKNQSVVYDLARLVDEAGKNDLIRTITQTQNISIQAESGQVYELTNTNDLLANFINKPPYKIEAAKTGYLPEAGYCLSVLFSENNEHEIIVVVLGSQSDAERFQDAKALASWVYETYQWET